MPVPHRPRRSVPAALTAFSLMLLAGCYGDKHPNSIFTNFTEFNRDVSFLMNVLLWLGILVFVFVELLLIYTIWRYRKQPGREAASHVHGNTKLEILWTIIPALVLVAIAVPTVKTIFRTQAKAKPSALHIQVIGHQWWWEFRYPQYTTTGPNGKVDTLVTANELYMPIGRTANFELRTADVLHSFWLPALGGKRDLISNHTNWLWYTPDSSGVGAWNGNCTEYCGASHANMKIRGYTVTPEDFESWAQNQLRPAVGTAPAAGAAAGAPVMNTATVTPQVPAPPAITGPAMAGVLPAAGVLPLQPGAPAPGIVAAPTGYTEYPKERLGRHNIPETPVAPAARIPATLQGNAEAGRVAFAQGAGGCIGCHKVRGVPTAMGVIGPNLSHFGGRHTFAAGLYQTDLPNLAAWIKNAPLLKPGSIMPTLGKGQYNPVTKTTLQAGLTDQQAADLAAYLLTLK